LNLNLKRSFEKGLKTEKKKTNLLTFLSGGPVARYPLSPAPAHAALLFFFSFPFADKPVPPVSLPPAPSFLLLPLLCLARPSAAVNPAAPGRLPFLSLPLGSAN
jgi:hypothetical protein